MSNNVIGWMGIIACCAVWLVIVVRELRRMERE